MNDPMVWAAICAAALAGIVVVTIAALKGWRDWIGLQRLLVEGRRGGEGSPVGPAGRIELADLRERVRKLEAIAAGVEL